MFPAMTGQRLTQTSSREGRWKLPAFHHRSSGGSTHLRASPGSGLGVKRTLQRTDGAQKLDFHIMCKFTL